jgi:ligand-binding sensor domain-containing protein
LVSFDRTLKQLRQAGCLPFQAHACFYQQHETYSGPIGHRSGDGRFVADRGDRHLLGPDESDHCRRERQSAASLVEVEEQVLRAPSTDGLTVYLDAGCRRSRSSAARYLATSGGLIALDEGGNVKRRYTTLDGLPENDLTALAVFRERLFAGTASAGLVSFDGQSFIGYRFVSPKATRVSVLVTTESELLIGTLDGGLFEYNGERFSRRFNSATGADFSRVTALLSFGSRLYIGTQDKGLYIWREHLEHITK